MQLENASGNASDDEEEGDLHILMLAPDLLIEDQDVAMDSVLLYPNQSTTAEALDSAVGAIQLEGEKVDSPMSTKAEFSPSDTALLNTSMNTPVVSVQPFKEEENPFSPDLDSLPLDEDMFPSLAPPQGSHPDPTSSVAPIPTQNYIIIGGVYYQPVPPPHNVVVAQSTIPMPALVPVPDTPATIPAPAVVPSEVPLPMTDTEANDQGDANPGTQDQPIAAAAAEPIQTPKPEEGHDFVTPKKPSTSGSSKDRRRSRPRSRSSSSCRSDSRPDASGVPRGVAPPDVTANAKKIRGIGREKPKDHDNVSLVAPSTSLAGITAPRPNLRITITAGNDKRIVEIIPDYPTNVAHLAKLEDEARNRWELQLPTAIKPEFVVEFPQEDPQEDSDIDLRTGEIKSSTPLAEPLQFTFNSLSVLEDHQHFGQEVLKLEPDSWDRTRVENNPSLFYHAYFLDQQKLSEVRQKGTVKIQQFNVKVTRQSPEKEVLTSSYIVV